MRADGLENFRFLLFCQVDTLRITATLEVENAFVGPAMLIVADQLAGRVGAQGGFTGTAQSKE
jgi:hypothetical protein